MTTLNSIKQWQQVIDYSNHSKDNRVSQIGIKNIKYKFTNYEDPKWNFVFVVYLFLIRHFICLVIHTHTYTNTYNQTHTHTHTHALSLSLYIYIYHHHHHVVLLARISLTLSRHFSLSFIASGRSSGLHPVSSQSCCMYVRAGRPAFARPYAGVHRSTSLMSSSLLLQQCPACLVRLTCIVFVMGGRWPYSWCLVGCCRQDLFNIARNILV